MYGMDWPTALCVFSMFALAGWVMHLLARDAGNQALVEEIVSDLRAVAREMDDGADYQTVNEYADYLAAKELDRGR